MERTEFEELAEEVLQGIIDAIENADSDAVLDIDFLDGVITLEFENGSQMVINRHGASQQIWLSSPHSGASHFFYDEGEEAWLDSDENELYTVLQEDIRELADIDVHF